ncbi:hypothetical protein HQ545_05820 [Candidatus Woesearchaeota archaeon]|nr:hypothetical protein [Candidatus Woesearchaeota archaeon]
MIIRQPDQFKQVIPSHPQLSQMFKGADIDEIIRLVKNSRSADREKLDLAGALK